MTSTDYVGLGTCMQGPAWVKMSSPTPAVSKKRKKPDTKPQSQLNKCLNEKRRREQENTYIEELAELIQASLASDMSSLSVKPDKCAILQQTVNQIRRLKATEGAGEGAVQQGEVSSSKPSLLPTQRLGPLLLEALDGFLFIVSTEGKIEFVSDKVSQFIKFTKEDLTGKSIYNIIHVGDHAKFSSSFMLIGWSGESECESSRSRSFNCRLLVRPPDDQEETMEEKQQRVSQYENMQISAVLLPSYIVDKSNSESFEGEGQQCLVCMVRRIPPNERIQGTPVEQFTTKLDAQGTIIAIDASGVSPRYSQYICTERIGEQFIELIHQGDVNKVTGHLRETLQAGHATSQVYRVKLGGDRCVRVQTKSKFFRDSEGTQPEGSFMMATHSIIGHIQDGAGSGDRLLAGTSGNGGVVLEEAGLVGGPGRPSSTGGVGDDSVSSLGDNTRLRKLLSHPDTAGDLSSDSSNKILKDLLNQKDEEEVGGAEGNSTMERIMARVPQQPHNFKPASSSSPSVNSSDNNMLRELLSDDNDDNENRKSSDDIWELLNDTPDEKKPDIKQEFLQPQGPGGTLNNSTSATNTSSSTSSSVPTLTSSSATSGLQQQSTGVPPRPQSADLLNPPSLLRGMKRPSDEAHDGNPSKQQVVVGAFESLLGPSPPGSMSPAPGQQHGGPPTPHGGPPTPHGGPPTHHGPRTPHGPPASLGNNAGVALGVGLNNQGSSILCKKNKMLASLLAKEPVQMNQAPTPSPHANPQSLPQDKLPKDLEKKLQTPGPWQASGRNQSEILSQLLTNSRTPGKVTTMPPGIKPPLQQPPGPGTASPIMCSPGSLTSQGHMTSQGGMVGGGVNNMSASGPPAPTPTSLGGVPVSLGGGGGPPGHHGVNTGGSVHLGPNSGGHLGTNSGSAGHLGVNSGPPVSGATTPTSVLPSFKSSMGMTPLGLGTSSFPEGSLPSITTATSNFPTLHNHNDDYLRQAVINDILEMTNNFPSGSPAEELLLHHSDPTMEDMHRPPTSSAHDLMEIQKIQNSLMSEIEAQQAPHSGPSQLPPYPAVSSHGSYPPPYNHRTRFPSGGPAGGPGGGGPGIPGHINPGALMRSQFPPGSPIMTSRPGLQTNQRMLRQQENTKRRLLQHQQQQVLVPSNPSEVTQPPPTSYQNMDDLFNNTVAPNRNVAESQTSPGYNLLNSPLAGGGQISPGQRIPQPPFSPHGQTPSPLPNQQYSNSGQMQGYQGGQGPQLSPRLSQGSPAPPSYPPSGPPLPQISPNSPGTSGTVQPGQQSPAWSSPGGQQRPSLMTQNPILNAQLNVNQPQLTTYMRSDGGRTFSGVGRAGQLQTMRSVPSPGARQSPYSGMAPPTPGNPGPQGDPYHPASPQQPGQMMYQPQPQQQQPQQPYRLQRAMSAPGQMAGVHTPRHYPSPGHHHDPPAPPPHLPGPPPVPPPSMAHPHAGHHHSSPLPPGLMASPGLGMGPGDTQHIMGGGPMGGAGPGGGMPGLGGGVMPQGYEGGLPPPPHNYEVAAHYYGAHDPARTSAEGNKWGSEGVNTNQAGGLSTSPRMDDSRSSSGVGEKGKTESMLKHLLSK